MSKEIPQYIIGRRKGSSTWSIIMTNGDKVAELERGLKSKSSAMYRRAEYERDARTRGAD